MGIVWTVEPSAYGDGFWFVAEGPEEVCVFAAPGVRLPDVLPMTCATSSRQGWRRAVWPLDDDPVIDFDPPTMTNAVSTASLCAELPGDLCETVRTVMVEQLTIALRFGEPRPGELVLDDTAHAGQAAAAWIVDELRAAFPSEAWELPRPSLLLTVIPDTSDGLLDVLPGARPREEPGIAGAELVAMLGARELLKLLSLLILRRVGKAVDVMAARSHPHLYTTVCEPSEMFEALELAESDRLIHSR